MAIGVKRTGMKRRAPSRGYHDHSEGERSFVMAHQEHKSCIAACVQCAQECEHCGTACIEENRPQCARICIDCAQICWSCAGYMSRGSSQMAAICGVCADICDV